MIGLQQRVHGWLRYVFGPHAAEHKVTRAIKFLEEALELAQACGISKDSARHVTNMVYSNAPGAIAQEIGGTVITLAALSHALGYDYTAEGLAEMKRVESPEAIEKIKSKDQIKKDKLEFQKQIDGVWIGAGFPIESAPKDGTKILIREPGQGGWIQAHWEDQYVGKAPATHEPFVVEAHWESDHHCEWFSKLNPDAWLPLPGRGEQVNASPIA